MTDKYSADGVAERAVELFNGGFNCAEAVATALAERLAPGPGQGCLPRAATCFGGGLGRRGETCGAVVGALLAAGIVRGRDAGEGDEAKNRAYALAEEIVEDFRAAFGCLRCRDLLGVDLRTPEGRSTFVDQDFHHKKCVTFIAAATRAAWRVLTT